MTVTGGTNAGGILGGANSSPANSPSLTNVFSAMSLVSANSGANFGGIFGSTLNHSSTDAYWRNERDRASSDVRARIVSVSHTLIALSAIVFGVLITALGMYAKRNRQLVGIPSFLESCRIKYNNPILGMDLGGLLDDKHARIPHIMD